MFIVMNCGGMPFNGETIAKKSLGGSETAAYYMARELAKLGHRVSVFTNIEPAEEGVWEDVKYISAGPITERQPLGARFHFYALNTLHDVCIIQRHPQAFTFKWASKLNVLWLHDLAIYRTAVSARSAMWNVDIVWTISEFHKKQVCEIYGLNPEIVKPITNGVDLSLFEDDKEIAGGARSEAIDMMLAEKGGDKDGNFIRLLYSSRPERGLIHHVREGGIMERLAEIDPRFHLYVCNYRNITPQMQDFYEYLYERIEKLPNCTDIGNLTKQQLADVMRQCDALVYPTEFEEVSCITAMEAMAAGLPFISSEHAALPETCKDSGSILTPLKDGKADEDAFIDYLLGFLPTAGNEDAWDERKEAQSRAAKNFSWDHACSLAVTSIKEVFGKTTCNERAMAKHLERVSDIFALNNYNDTRGSFTFTCAEYTELKRHYGFVFSTDSGAFAKHYEAYYEYEKNRGVNYGPEKLDGNPRYEHVSSLLRGLPADATVLDYGCAHGHYTVNLAKRYPNLRFIGIDLVQSNIDKARAWADADGVKNARFYTGSVVEKRLCLDGSEKAQLGSDTLDAIIAAEVLEHVPNPQEVADVLINYLKPDGLMIITTPYGPWEAQGYKEHDPWRAHLHHFEREDLHDMWGGFPKFSIAVAPSGASPELEAMGSYITSFVRPQNSISSGFVNYDRKFKQQAPRQTLSVCMIVRDAELTLARCLDSIKDVSDEIIVAVDNQTKDRTREIAEEYGATVFDIPSPLETGFDEARNRSIEKATGNWIMWIDADEVFYTASALAKYLRHNQLNAYSMAQIHYTVQPAGILRTDYPCRIFRNGRGIKFFGLVHEHPELNLNEGIGHAMILSDISIAHNGYSTEQIRRKRFHRNIGLLTKDREKYPDRKLGKYLWMRDLAQMCQYEHEQNGGVITPEMNERAKQGLQLWEELLVDGQTRMLLDGLEFYSTLVKVTGGGFNLDMQFGAALNGGQIQGTKVVGRFASRKHVNDLFQALLKERTEIYESKYF